MAKSTGANAKAPVAVAPAATPPAEEEGDKLRRTCLHNQLHKTKFCMYYLRGLCQYGSGCAFAHSCAELQGTPDLHKTRLCQKGKSCTDSNCTFAHGEEELRSTEMFYKKTLCIWNEKGRCRNGAQCRFAHGPTELRVGPWPDVASQGKEHIAAPAAAAPPAKGAGKGGRRRAKATGGSTGTRLPSGSSSSEGRQFGSSSSSGGEPDAAEPMKVQTGSLDPQSAARQAQMELLQQKLAAEAQIAILRQNLSVLAMQCNQIKEQVCNPEASAAMYAQDMALGFAPEWYGDANAINAMNANVAALLMEKDGDMNPMMISPGIDVGMATDWMGLGA